MTADETKEESGAVRGGEEFEQAAARVTAPVTETEADATAATGGTGQPQERLLIRLKWAEGASRLLFFPPAKFIHPAWALEDEEAQKIGEYMQPCLQALVDRWEYLIPSWLAKVENRFPELSVLLAVVAGVAWEKHKTIKLIRAQEELERLANTQPETPPRKPKTGERDAEGTLIV